MATYEVEFWPGRIVTIENAPNPDVALLRAIEARTVTDEWPGDYEMTAQGFRFQVLVREI